MDAGVVCRCDGVLFGSGSLSDEEEEDELDESDEALSGVPRAGLSPSGSSRVLAGFREPDAKPGSPGVVWRQPWYPLVVVHQLACGWQFFLRQLSVLLRDPRIWIQPYFCGLRGLLLGEYRKCGFPTKLPFGDVRGLLLSRFQHGLAKRPLVRRVDPVQRRLPLRVPYIIVLHSFTTAEVVYKFAGMRLRDYS